FWEKNSFLHYDYIIIGSGIVGLSTACSLKEQQPTASVLVLERGVLPSGASTKNAGFACIGSPTELLSDLQKMSESDTLSLLELRWRGLHRLRQRLSDEKIGYLALGSYELISDKESFCLDHLTYLNQLIYPIIGKIAFSETPELLLPFGFNRQYVKTLVKNHAEGQLDTGKMMRSLWEYANSLGVIVTTGAKVQQIIPQNNTVQLVVESNVGQTNITYCAHRQVAICTNAFAKQFLPDADIRPGRGQVLVTKPIETLPFQGIFHYDEGFYYFRNYENRVILGGGRNLDFEGETTTDLHNTTNITDNLIQQLHQIILPNTAFEIDSYWAGIMAFGKDKMPILQRVDAQIVAAVRLGGMGVAIGS
ncbi:MAG TPA: FAD-dependent oxidoreductase, partial [Chitinophagales bacterium]|nr:FAD-dependent oxidoreductase [Chitinophagales bacterium]